VDFLQEIIDHGIEIEPIIINGKWCEIDTLEDLELAKKLFHN
jgi:choline kinase